MGLMVARFSFKEWECGSRRSNASAPMCTFPNRRRWPATRRAERATLAGRRSRPGDLPFLERLDQVTRLEVLVVAEADAALEALADLAGVVLEPLERGDLPLPEDDAVAEEPDLGPAGDDTRPYLTSGDGSHARDPEDLTHFGLARDDLFELGGEHADHGRLDVLEQLVDDLVGPNLDVGRLGRRPRLAVGADVEADDGGARR